MRARTCASTSCSVVATLSTIGVPYACEVQGQRITDGPYTNTWWSKVYTRYTGGNPLWDRPGYVSDVYISGGSNNTPIHGVAC